MAKKRTEFLDAGQRGAYESRRRNAREARRLKKTSLEEREKKNAAYRKALKGLKSRHDQPSAKKSGVGKVVRVKHDTNASRSARKKYLAAGKKPKGGAVSKKAGAKSSPGGGSR